MKRGLFGFPRFSSIGPLKPGGFIFNEPDFRGADRVMQEVTDIAEDMGVELDTTDPDDIEEVKSELAERIYPDSERHRKKLEICIESDWATNWSDGLEQSTGFENSPLEDMAATANGCIGMVEANTLGD